jgi:hypothetical protein
MTLKGRALASIIMHNRSGLKTGGFSSKGFMTIVFSAFAIVFFAPLMLSCGGNH